MHGRFVVFTVLIIVVFSIGTACSHVKKTEGKPDTGFEPAAFEKKKTAVFEYGYVSRPGDYYEMQLGKWVSKKLPAPESTGTVLWESWVGDSTKAVGYYYVEGDGWEGWVDKDNFLCGPITGEVNVAKLNCRAAPSGSAAVAGQLNKGDILDIRSRSKNREVIDGVTGYWYEIGDGRWVFEPYVTLLHTYDMLAVFDSDISPTGPNSALTIKIVEDILAAPQHLYRPYWHDEYRTPENSVQSQALYEGCTYLLNGSPDAGETEYRKILEWAGELKGKYGNEKVSWFLFDFDPANDATMFELEALANLGDREGYTAAFNSAFVAIGDEGIPSYEVGTYYGLDMLREVDSVPEAWRPSLFETAIKNAPTRRLAAAAKYFYACYLVENPETAARGKQMLLGVIDDYPEEEFGCGLAGYDNYAQHSLLEYARLLPDDAARREFLKKYAGNDTPEPVRFAARCFLADGYSDYFGPLDGSFEKYIQGYEGPYYWFYN